ncbi:aldo/keto reductase [Rubrobacter indicoceani]|uniref:aldo/keto reductase n=1 Tax=Rubrobacter indicoceani TaxID=2051957 RepID=UPI000E5BEBE7|nr:aldo/keto reductase [Rubrobacter indicoceani]
MEYRRLGETGLMVSELCLGTMTFGRELDEEGSVGLLRMFFEAGGNFVDTADVYEVGLSEEITGRAMKSAGLERDEVVLATKVRFPMGEGPNDVGLSRKHVISGCEASLRRLGTDYIDLYQVHMWDAATPLDETLSALTDLVRAGKVRYIGCSNYAAWQLVKALWRSELKGYERFVSIQPQYSLVERNIEREVVPACVEEGVGLMPWGPLGGGFLSGKYRRGQEPPEGSRIADAPDELEEAWHRRSVERNWRTLDVIEEISSETGKSFPQIALNWLLRQPGVASPILGARKPEQLKDNLGASGWKLDKEQVSRLSEASAIENLYPQRMIDGAQRI